MLLCSLNTPACYNIWTYLLLIAVGIFISQHAPFQQRLCSLQTKSSFKPAPWSRALTEELNWHEWRRKLEHDKKTHANILKRANSTQRDPALSGIQTLRTSCNTANCAAQWEPSFTLVYGPPWAQKILASDWFVGVLVTLLPFLHCVDPSSLWGVPYVFWVTWVGYLPRFYWFSFFL